MISALKLLLKRNKGFFKIHFLEVKLELSFAETLAMFGWWLAIKWKRALKHLDGKPKMRHALHIQFFPSHHQHFRDLDLLENDYDPFARAHNCERRIKITGQHIFCHRHW